MKKLYYTVNLETKENEFNELIVSSKNITVYYVEDNTLKIFCEIETRFEDNSEEEIQTYLDNNGFEAEYEFALL